MLYIFDIEYSKDRALNPQLASPNGDKFDFLATNIVETVVNALQAGVEKYNAWLQNDTDAAHYSKRERSQKRRADLCAKLRQFLSAVDNISVHEKRGTLLIAVGSDHLLHVKNINRYSLLASIPKMLQEPKD